MSKKKKQLLQEYVEKMEYDHLCGEIAVEVAERSLAHVQKQLKNSTKGQKAALQTRAISLEGHIKNYKDFMDTAASSKEVAKQKLSQL